MVAVEKLDEVVLPDGIDDDIAWDGVNAVVEVPIEDANLVIHDHGPVASASVLVCPRRETVLRRESLCFEDRSDIIVTVSRLRLTRSQMAVDKAHRAVVENKAKDEGALHGELEPYAERDRTDANLVAVQPSHAPFHFRSADVPDIVAFLVLDKDTGEEPDHIGRMKKDIRLFERHTLMESPSKMIDPHPILSAHMLFLSVFLLLTAKQQTLCKDG